MWTGGNTQGVTGTVQLVPARLTHPFADRRLRPNMTVMIGEGEASRALRSVESVAAALE
jgi:hypothetical protein